MILGQCSYLRFIIISLDNMHFETGCFWRLLGCQLSSCPCLCLQPSRIWASEGRNKVSILPGQYQSDTNTSTGINTIDIWITSTQTQTLLQQTAYSWKSVFGLAFLSIARHCVGYSVAHYFFLRGYVLPVGWWWGGAVLCVHAWGYGAWRRPPLHSRLFALQTLPERTVCGEIPGMLSTLEQRWKDNQTLARCFQVTEQKNEPG